MAVTTRRVDLDAAMKILFEEPVVSNVVEDSELMSFIERDVNVEYRVTEGGRYVERSHDFRKGGSAGMRSEGDYIPVANKPLYRNSRIKLRKLQGTVELSGDAMRRVRQDETAFLDYMERVLPDCVVRIVNSIDRQYVGTGFGHKARVAGKGADYITVDRACGITGVNIDPWKQFLEGDSLVFSPNANGTSLRAGGTNRFAIVANIDETLNRIYLTNPDGSAMDATLLSNVTTNDYIFEGDNAGASVQDPADSEYREISGLIAGVDDGNIVATYHNLTRATVGRLWQGMIVDTSAAALGFNSQMSEELLVYGDEQVAERGSGKITHLVMSRSANRGYWKSLKGDRVFNDPRGDYHGGKAQGLQIILGDRTVTIKVARKMPTEFAFGLQKDTWKRYGLGNFEWDDASGSIWNRATDATGRMDQFYAVGNMYEELECAAPRKNVRFDNLTATA